MKMDITQRRVLAGEILDKADEVRISNAAMLIGSAEGASPQALILLAEDYDKQKAQLTAMVLELAEGERAVVKA